MFEMEVFFPFSKFMSLLSRLQHVDRIPYFMSPCPSRGGDIGLKQKERE